MLKKVLLVIFFILCGYYLWLRTPISSDFYLSKGITEYNAKHYNAAVSILEHSLGANPNNSKAEYYYAKSLAKMPPTYSVQKKLYKIATESKYPASKEVALVKVAEIKKDLLKDLNGNYIYNAMQGKEILRWDIKSFPLKVYFENLNEVPSYYKENIFKAMEQWEKSTGFVKFEQTADKNNAKIYVIFRDINTDCSNEKDCRYTIAYTEPVIKSGNILKQVNFTFHKTNPKNVNYSSKEVYNTALHELGHALGLMGHSDNPNDVMYSNNDRATDAYSQYRSDSQYLSMRDLKTLALLYNLAPTICDTKETKKENYYYPPLVLGSQDEVLLKKVNELEKYIKKYPKFAAGYINISSVYADLGEKEKGLEYLKKAEKLATTEDEKFMTYYNRAVIYFNSQDFKSAKKAALKAQNVKNTAEIQSIIQEIENRE